MADQRVLMIESACYISVDTGRILLKRGDGKIKTELASDLALICLNHDQITITVPALRAMHLADCTVMTTDVQHMPSGVMYPLSAQANSVAVTRLRQQITLDSKAEAKAKLWQQIIAQKIQNSALVLRLTKAKGAVRLERLSKQVLPADKQNVEGQAAKHFWQNYFSQPHLQEYTQSRKKLGAADAINIRLNYGYAVLRAMLSRELLIAGLNPILAVGHKNQGNPFNLADDLIEPYRCIVELSVARLNNFDAPFVGLEKKRLLDNMQIELRLSNDPINQFRLAQAVAQTVKSFCGAISTPDRDAKLKLPTEIVEPANNVIESE
jgi:CRISP-associated protein Cas1